ncbi:hypothetical protein BGZ96_001791 [Linnemannia gamsii]|uniref:Uncharacterized protein n=1 Tax=Linnemannia gamsii TaxID=64522 RepID=A0ABQ7K9B3_9FUNG|nr:hypothetical protein BGZ96_001791 [Linnemannia gamsii]
MPAEQTTTTAAPHKPTAAPTRTSGSARPTSSGTNRTTSARGNNSRSIIASISGSTTTRTPTPTISPVPEAGGMSGAAIGGMAAGGAAIAAIIGLLCYKRRKRSAVGDSTAAAAVAAGKKKDEEAMAELGGAYTGPNKAISGPIALAPQNGKDTAPSHRPEAQFREQQQYRPGMRDELFAQPGSALHGTMSKSPASPTSPGAPPRPPAPATHQNTDQVNNNNQGSQVNSPDNSRPPLQKQHSHPGSEGYYDDVNDYYGDDSISVVPEPMGAQRSAPQPRNLTQGNLTPTPVSQAATSPTAGTPGGMGPPSTPKKKTSGMDSPRSSYSSEGGESAYLTLEQAQQAHNHKMMGHKESISSVDMLLERSGHNGNGQFQNQGQNSPYGYNNNNNNNNNNLAPPARSPMPPMSPDPYAASAYSDYLPPPPSGGGGSPYGGYQQQQQPQHGNGYNNNTQRNSDYNQGPYGRF